MKMLIALEPHVIFCSNVAYLYTKALSRDWYATLFSDLYRVADALPNFIGVHAACTSAIQIQVSLEKFSYLIK